jgi:hypothetical protein
MRIVSDTNYVMEHANDSPRMAEYTCIIVCGNEGPA